MVGSGLEHLLQPLDFGGLRLLSGNGQGERKRKRGGAEEPMRLHVAERSRGPVLNQASESRKAESATIPAAGHENSQLVGNDACELLAFRLADGAPAWSRRIEGVPRGLSREGSLLFVGTLDGAVLAYEYPESGR
jgi:hypothetical protein